MAELLQKDAQSWTSFVKDFDKAWIQFSENYSALIKLKPYIYTKHPELRREYDSLVKSGEEKRATLLRLKNVRDTAKNWLTGVVSTAKGYFGLEGLGIIPVVIGIASASTAVAAITYWIADAYKFAQRVNALQALEAKGYPPDVAARAIEKAAGPVEAAFFGIPVKWLLIGGFLMVLLPPVLARFGRK